MYNVHYIQNVALGSTVMWVYCSNTCRQWGRHCRISPLHAEGAASGEIQTWRVAMATYCSVVVSAIHHPNPHNHRHQHQEHQHYHHANHEDGDGLLEGEDPSTPRRPSASHPTLPTWPPYHLATRNTWSQVPPYTLYITLQSYQLATWKKAPRD